LPTQLTKLTCLDVNYEQLHTAKSQLQHLSSMTALQDLHIEVCRSCSPSDFPGVQQLLQLQLKSLGIKCYDLEFSTVSTSKWAPCLTALESLKLTNCDIELEAIAALTRLRALRLVCDGSLATGHGFLAMVSQLQLLTELHVQLDCNLGALAQGEAALSLPVTAVFEASTYLCSLQLGLIRLREGPHRWNLLRPGTTYPHLRCIDLDFDDDTDDM
jgi:hypothetical protein